MKRRTLIRTLVGIGFGVPIAVEGATLVGMVGDQFTGTSQAEPSETTTVERTGVGVGDDLLEKTQVSETVTEAVVAAGEDNWTFTLGLEVENTTEASYRLALGSVATRGGEQVPGGYRVQVAPGESEQLTGTWRLPAGERPVSVRASAVLGSDRTVGKAVKLDRVPVQS